jgi:hypothetical protein
MGIRKYPTLSILPFRKYQQLWKIDVNNVQVLNAIEFDDLSPLDVSFLRKKIFI